MAKFAVWLQLLSRLGALLFRDTLPLAPVFAIMVW
jgi:hypothetical protein